VKLFPAFALLLLLTVTSIRADEPKPLDNPPASIPEGISDETVADRVFDPNWLDPKIRRANVLEILLNKKVRQIIKARAIPERQFASSTSISVNESWVMPPKNPNAKKPEKDAKDDDGIAAKDDSDKPELDLDGRIVDADYLISQYESDVEKDEKEAAQKRKEKRAEELKRRQLAGENTTAAADEDTPQLKYEVGTVLIQATVSDQLPKDTVAGLEQNLKSAFSPAFGNRLTVQVRTGKFAAESQWPLIVKWLRDLEALAIALAIGAIALLALLILKFIPSWQLWRALKTEHTQKNFKETKGTVTRAKKEEPNAEEEKTKPEREMAPPPFQRDISHMIGSEEEGEEAKPAVPVSDEERARDLRAKIVEYAKKQPSAARTILQEWVGTDEMFTKIALLLETLAEQGVQLEKINVRPQALRAIRACRAAVSKFAPEELRLNLEDIYWNLVSTGFFGEERAVSPFIFMDALSDASILKMLADEPIAEKAAVVLGLRERRAASLLSRLHRDEREGILGLVFSGNPMNPKAIESLISRLKTKAALKSGFASQMDGSEDALVPILEKMPFESQFAAARTLLDGDPAQKKSVLESFFNVAFLSEATNDFITQTFVDRSAEWIHAVLSRFGADFRQRVIDVLPPIQQRMLLEMDGMDMLPGVAMKILKDLNKEINDKIVIRTISLQDIYGLESESVTENSAAEPVPLYGDRRAA
jgi:flagellar motor switch protein FliG